MSKELKSLVFSINDLAYVDEVFVKKNFDNPHDHAVYKATEVDALIAEKDKEIAELKDKIEKLRKVREVHIEAIASMEAGLHQDAKEIESLKAKLEDVQASMYADVVDANMKVRRLTRALYKVCAKWAMREAQLNSSFAYDASEYLPSKEAEFRKTAERWSNMERKCLAMAERYGDGGKV